LFAGWSQLGLIGVIIDAWGACMVLFWVFRRRHVASNGTELARRSVDWQSDPFAVRGTVMEASDILVS
jgi:hypothetical protein